VVNEPANKDDKPFLVDDARQRLIDEVWVWANRLN